MIEWAREHEAVVWWLGAASVVTFVGTLIVIPILVTHIPADYFAHRKRPRSALLDRHPVVQVLIVAGRNLLGLAFVAAGIAMLLLPGQGIITVLIGIMLMWFPGKYAFERWLVRRRMVLRTINWMRTRSHHEPLTVYRKPPGEPPADDGSETGTPSAALGSKTR